MRIAAVALVLVVGAAVVLWFGNTLNSWVLGGLIGGLAALLLSIPISLTLFSFLSQRHDQRLAPEEQEPVSLARAYQYTEAYADVYEDEASILLPDEEEMKYEELESPFVPEPHQLPPAGQSQASMPTRKYQHRAANYLPVPRQQSLPVAQEKRATPQRPPAQPHSNRSGFLGYQANTYRQHQTEALRIARQEALRRNGIETPSYTSKKLPAARTEQPLIQQPDRPRTQRASRQLPPQMPQMPQQPRSKRIIVDADPVQQNGYRRSLPAGGESTANRPTRSSALRTNEAQTDNLRGQQYPETGPMRPQPSTGQIVRNPQIGEQRRNPDTITGSLKNPLVRRAPYTYEDDPIRQQFAQQIDGPITRRSSLFENDEEE